ncbi:MAG: RND transporter [Deltaproteobacteria bacterium HGW-Deltaproteobacteria-1]|nr:MAG: RND transporter [Deltaproteobacteria bacterium HGW-Deltaproteobacteria-1]
MKSAHRTTYIRSASSLLVALLITIISGCVSVGPDYVRPDITIYKDWHTKIKIDPSSKETNAQLLAVWWGELGDPKLTGFIEHAVKGNLDLKKAQARVREARARRGVAKAGYFPTLNATGSANQGRSIEDTGSGATSDLYSVGFDASWELDIFGGVRRSVEATQANLEASEEDRRDVLVSLLAEVAINYIDVRTYQARLAAAEANLKSQEETHQLTVWRNQAGLSDELAVQQARLNLENTRSKVPALRTGLEEAMNRIAVLLGEQPGNVHAELTNREAIPLGSLNVAVVVPADVMRRRPDVRKAERNLASQTAKVGVATADLYPKFKMSGTIGLDALSIGNLFLSGSRNYSFGPSITIPLFAGGSIRKNIDVQSALQEQYLIAYETAVLNALEEVENALVAYTEEQSRRQWLIDAATAAKLAAQLAKIKYESGITDFTSVLDADRSLLSAEDDLAQSEGKVTANLIRLYKALGGGWTSAAKEN